MEKPIKVRILDQEYLIKSNENEEHVEKVAQFVNQKFREIKESAAGLSEKKTALSFLKSSTRQLFRSLGVS